MSNEMRFPGVTDACLVALRALMEDEDIARALRAAPTPTLRRYRHRFSPSDFHALISLGRNALGVLENRSRVRETRSVPTHRSPDAQAESDAETYAIRGRVELGGATAQTVAGLTVELWEKNAAWTSARTSVVTDDTGRFEALVHVRDLATPSREIYFRLLSDGTYLAPDPTTTWSPREGGAPIVLVVSGTHVEGHLRNQDGTAVSGYTVNVLDSQIRAEVLLSSAVTDSDGFYSIDVASPLPKLDLMVRAYEPPGMGGTEVAHASLTTSVGQSVVIDLVVGNTDLAGTSEYGAIYAALALEAARAGVAVTDLTTADVTALAAKYGLAAGLFQLAIDANVAATDAGNGLMPELFYAIGHARQRVSISFALAVAHDDRLGAINHAIAANWVSSAFAAVATTPTTGQLAVFEGLRSGLVTSSLVAGTAVTVPTRLAVILAISGMTSTTDQAAFLTPYFDYASSLDQFWANATSLTGLAAGVLTNAQNALSIGLYTLNHPPMVQSLWADGIQTPQALAQQTEASLAARCAATLTFPLPGGGTSASQTVGVPGEISTGSATDYAHAIATATSQAFPSSALVAAYNASPIPGTTATGASIAAFFSAPVNAGFDFASTSVPAWVRLNSGAFSGNTGAQPLVEKMARLFKISPEVGRYTTVANLWDAGFDSARSVFLYGKQSFLAKMMAAPYSWTETQALAVFNKAAHTSALATQIALQYGPSFQAPGSSGAIVQVGLDSNGAVSPPSTIIPDWSSMFGSLDYCQCDECAGVLGAPAYLTDLLHFLEQRPSTSAPKMLQTLRGRRPDITKTQLSCTNTNTVMPTIDIINEALELRVHPTALAAPVMAPDSIEGLAGWWRADRMSVDGSGHVLATDLSGHGNTLTSTSTTLTLTAQAAANNQVGLVCDGSGALAGKTLFQGTADPPCTFVCIAQTTETTAIRFFWSNGGPSSGGTGYAYVINDGATSLRSSYDTSHGPTPVDNEPLTAAFEVSAWIGHGTGATAGNREVWVNGTQHALGGSNYDLPAADGTGTGFFLGGWATSNSDAMVGVIYEMIVYDRALTPSELKGLSSYAHQRYGTALPLTTWTPAYQTTWTEPDLAIHPEHVLTPAYDDLAAVIYPWSMPYAFYLDEARAYVGLKNVTRAEIHAASVVDPIVDAAWAKEILGLSDLQQQIIDGTASYQPYQYWGVNSPPSPCWYSPLATVPALLAASGLDYDDAAAIVGTSFVKAAVAPPITVDLHGGCDTTAATLDNLDLTGTTSAPFFDRTHRFARLWKALGWTIRQTDRAIMNLGAGSLASTLWAPLAYAKEIVRRTGAPLDTVLTWRDGAPIDTALAADGGPSPFERLFPPTGTGTAANAFGLTIDRTALADESQPLANYYVALAGGLGTDVTSIEDIVTYASLGSAKLTLASISTIFRYVTLAETLKLSVSSLLVLLQLTGRTPFSAATPDHAIRLLDDAADATAFGLSVEDIQYFLQHQDTSTPKSTLVTCKVNTDANFTVAAPGAVLDANGNVTSILPGGLVASIPGLPDLLFTNRDTVPAGVNTNLTVTFVCTQAGPFACPAGRLTALANMPAIAGWTSITNDVNGVPGADGTKTPSDSTIAAFFKALRTGLGAVAAKPVDTTGNVTSSYLGQFYSHTNVPSDADIAYAIVSGTAPLPIADGGLNMDPTAQNTWISGHGWSQFITDIAAAEANLTSPAPPTGTGLVGAAARFGYFQPLIQQFIDRQSLVISSVASAFKLTNATADALLRTYVHARTVGGSPDTQFALALLTSLATVTANLSLPTVPAYWYTYLHLQKVAAIVTRLELGDGDLAWTFESVGATWHGHTNLDALPVLAVTTSGTFLPYARLVHAAGARADFAGGALFDIFTANETGFYGSGAPGLTALLTDVAHRTGWDETDLETIAANQSPTPLAVTDFVDELPILRLKNAQGVTERLGIAAATIFPAWTNVTFPATPSDEQALKDAVRGTFTADAWPGVVKPARNALRERQRDALVDYLVNAPGVLPTQLPGLVLWLRADMGVTLDGAGNVVSWGDQSGCGNDFSQSTIAQRPGYSSAEPAYLHTNGAGGASDLTHLTGSVSNITNAETYIVVYTPASPQGYVITQGGNPSSIVDSDGANTIVWYNNWGGGTIDSKNFTTSSTIGAPTIASIAQTDGTAGAKLYLNGAVVQTFTPTAGSKGIDTVMGYSAGSAMGGHLFEVIAFNRQLTDDEIGKVHAYLAARYGVTLNASPTARRYLDSDDLSGDVLLDVEQESCGQTSRIVQALASTQTFLERVLLNLESGYSLSTDDARQWKWMKQYRIWQANREIFLFPENWIEPSLRDDKTPLFQDFETDVAKGDLTSDLVEDAVAKYLGGLAEISNMEVAASVVDVDPDTGQKTLHVVSRTRAQPPVYYYRTRPNGQAWSAWTKVDVDIQSEHALLAIYNRRPFLFWANVTESSKTADQAKQQTTANAPAKQFQIRLRWTSLRRGKWGKLQQSVTWIPDENLVAKPAEQRFDVYDSNSTDGSGPSPTERLRRAVESLAFRFRIDPVTDDLQITVINSNVDIVNPA